MNTMTETAGRTGSVAPPYPELAATLRGRLITPEAEDYDTARAVYNAMIDRRPAAIARVADAADVVACVNFARTTRVDLRSAAAGTTPAASGCGTTPWSSISAACASAGWTRRHSVRVDGGCTWADVDHATLRTDGEPTGLSARPASAA